MKNILTGFVLAVCIGVMGVAVGGQTVYTYVAKYLTGGAALLTVDAQGDLYTASGSTSVLAASGVPFVVKGSAGRVVTLDVISASGVGGIYDSATAASAVAARQIAAIPATVGTYHYDFPAASGIVIDPSSSVVSVSYR